MDQILYEVSDRVAVITLNRPEVASAQNMALLLTRLEGMKEKIKNR